MRFLSILFYFLCSLLYYDYTNTHFLTRHICGISHTRGKEFRKYCPRIFDSEEEKGYGEWCRSSKLINVSNESCNNISDSYLRVGNDSMIEIIFQTTSKGDLPNLYYIFHKIERLGEIFNNVDYYITCALLLI